MKVKILKYRETDGIVKNFFSFPAPNYIDMFETSKFLESGFPVFNMEFAKQDDVFTVQAPDFDLRLSTITGITSETENKNLTDFLIADTEDNLFIVIVDYETGDPRDDVCGKIENNTIEVDDTIGKCVVNFMCIGIDKELREHLSTGMIPGTGVDNFTFDTWLNFLMPKVPTTGMVFRNECHIENRFGGAVPKMSRPLLNAIVQPIGGIGYNAPLVRIPIWQGLLEIMQGLGIAWSVEHVGELSPSKPVFEFRMFFRTDLPAGDPVEFKPLNGKDVIKLASAYAQRNVLITYEQYATLPGRNFSETGYTALLINDKWNNYVPPNQTDPQLELGPIRITDTGGLKFINNMYPLPPYPYDFGGLVTDKKFYLTQLPVYDENKLPGQPPPNVPTFNPKIPLCRIFVFDWTENQHGIYADSGFNQVISGTARQEYQFLKSGFKKKRLIKTTYEGAPPKPLDVVKCKGENHWLERVTNADDNTKEVELEMNEI